MSIICRILSRHLLFFLRPRPHCFGASPASLTGNHWTRTADGTARLFGTSHAFANVHERQKEKGKKKASHMRTLKQILSVPVESWGPFFLSFFSSLAAPLWLGTGRASSHEVLVAT